MPLDSPLSSLMYDVRLITHVQTRVSIYPPAAFQSLLIGNQKSSCFELCPLWKTIMTKNTEKASARFRFISHQLRFVCWKNIQTPIQVFHRSCLSLSLFSYTNGGNKWQGVDGHSNEPIRSAGVSCRSLTVFLFHYFLLPNFILQTIHYVFQLR